MNVLLLSAKSLYWVSSCFNVSLISFLSFLSLIPSNLSWDCLCRASVAFIAGSPVDGSFNGIKPPFFASMPCIIGLPSASGTVTVLAAILLPLASVVNLSVRSFFSCSSSGVKSFFTLRLAKVSSSDLGLNSALTSSVALSSFFYYLRSFVEFVRHEAHLKDCSFATQRIQEAVRQDLWLVHYAPFE